MQLLGWKVYGILVSDIKGRTFLIPEGRVVKIFSCVQSTQCAGALREDIMPIDGGRLVARVPVTCGPACKSENLSVAKNAAPKWKWGSRC